MAIGIDIWIEHMRDRVINPTAADQPLVLDLLDGANLLARVKVDTSNVSFDMSQSVSIRKTSKPESAYSNFVDSSSQS